MEVESEVAGYAEGLVTVSEGTGAGVARLSNKDRRRLVRRRLACRARVRSAGEARSDSKAAAAASRARFARRFLEPHVSRNFFLGGEPVGVEEAVSEMEAEGSEMMTASTGS